MSKRGGSWTLHYVKSAYAVTDVPDEVSCHTYDQTSFGLLTLASGPRIDLAAKTLAQRFILRRYPQYIPLLLHLSLSTHSYAQILDSLGDVVSIF